MPDGLDETGNRVVRSWGEPPELPCQAKAHWDIATDLGIIDFDGGSALAGSGFAVYRGAGAKLNRALISWFLDTLTGEFDYLEHGLPILVKTEVMQGTEQLPKFADQIYTAPLDDLHLIPTAEVPLTNLPKGEILAADDLPLKFTAPPCFRREAGAAGIGTRGIQRVHQFDKVEMVQLVHPDVSRGAGDHGRDRRSLLQRLGLHYRVLELCAGDTGFRSTSHLRPRSLEPRHRDLAGGFELLELPATSRPDGSRCATVEETGAKPSFLHTLNGSGLALPRVVIALLETGLLADGRSCCRPCCVPISEVSTSSKPWSLITWMVSSSTNAASSPPLISVHWRRRLADPGWQRRAADARDAARHPEPRPIGGGITTYNANRRSC